MSAPIPPGNHPRRRVRCLFEGGSAPRYRLAVSPTLVGELEEGRRNREVLIGKLPSPKRDECLKVLDSVDQIEELVQEIFEANGERQIGKKRELTELINSLDPEPPPVADQLTFQAYLKKKQEAFPYDDLCFFEGNSFEVHLITIEQTRNVYINRISYQNEVEEFVRRNEKAIIARFCPSSTGNPLRFQVKPIKEGRRSSETHHGGKEPKKIEFCNGERLVFTVIYKPRAAELDSKVIETFLRINSLPQHQRSRQYSLPNYQIWACGEASIWEFIPGGSLKSGKKLKDALGLYPRENPALEKESLKDLDYLDAVLNQMRIGDLHHENTILENEGIKAKPLRLIPIDLENYRPKIIYGDFSTGLGGSPQEVKLSPKELEIIGAFKNEVEPRIPFRYVILDTEKILRLVGDYTRAQGIATMFYKQLQAHGIQDLISIATLQSYIEKDILNGDVPYFAENNGIVYYGLHTNRLKIGRILKSK